MSHDDDAYAPKFPKPPARHKAARKGIKPMSRRVSGNRALRAAVRREVITRDEGRCRVCRALVWDAGHAHEILYRSRGGDPHDARNIVLVCASCHAEEHAHRIRITGDALHLTVERLR